MHPKVSEKLIAKLTEFAQDQSKLYGVPLLFHLNLSKEKGLWLAQKLQADNKIVLLGTLLMDFMLGKAIMEKKPEMHIEWSIQKARELLDGFSVADSLKENVLACIREHHGAKEFYSKEAEICCNADCYRFASVEGVIGGMRYMREMSLPDLVNLCLRKATEKYQALSLDLCRQELEPQYKLIKQFLSAYIENHDSKS